jgi:hypothetical protein
MRKTLILVFLVSLSAPALAIYKCEAGGKISYSDNPCGNGKSVRLEESPRSTPLSPDVATARQQATRDKNELKRLENERQQREAQEDKERRKLAQADAAKRKKCAELALQQKWAEEDAGAASGKSVEKAKRNARRKAEKLQMECGK